MSYFCSNSKAKTSWKRQGSCMKIAQKIHRVHTELVWKPCTVGAPNGPLSVRHHFFPLFPLFLTVLVVAQCEWSCSRGNVPASWIAHPLVKPPLSISKTCEQSCLLVLECTQKIWRSINISLTFGEVTHSALGTVPEGGKVPDVGVLISRKKNLGCLCHVSRGLRRYGKVPDNMTECGRDDLYQTWTAFQNCIVCRTIVFLVSQSHPTLIL